MRCEQLTQAMDRLRSYVPFGLLAEERLAELPDVVRIFTLHQGEVLHLQGSQSRDLLHVIEGQVRIIQDGTIKVLDANAGKSQRPHFMHPAPATCIITAASDALLCHADRELLDRLVTWDEMIQTAEDLHSVSFAQRLVLVGRCPVFRQLPIALLEVALERMHLRQVKAGETIIEPGDAAEAFYLIAQGRAELWRLDAQEKTLRKERDLETGTPFGSECLLTGRQRDELVRMTSDGALFVLDKVDFDALIRKPLVHNVTPAVTRSMLDSGYQLIDVRYPEEFDDMHIPGSRLIPLHELPNRLGELDKSQRYIVYCHSGNRSAIAALKLAQEGIEVLSLEGGIRDWPYETKGNVWTETDPDRRQSARG